MKKHKNKIYSLDDVRQWKSLKKDELDLEKLKFYAEKDKLKSEFAKGFGSVLFYQGMLIAGEKIIVSLLNSLFKSTSKKEKLPEDKKKET